MAFDIHIIGGGLAGSEAAWQLAEAGLRVRLSEMRGGGDITPAHETDRLAEMVCSNSFRSDDAEHNAVGLLHQEMRALGSLVMRAADTHRVPAGSALAVDREAFAAEVTRAIESHPNISVVRERVDSLPDHPTIIATGPLTGSNLAESIAAETGEGLCRSPADRDTERHRQRGEVPAPLGQRSRSDAGHFARDAPGLSAR
jgi:methylenetetrahydrofolate--tRNA-(uracil-5-)-methyltransferase